MRLVDVLLILFYIKRIDVFAAIDIVEREHPLAVELADVVLGVAVDGRQVEAVVHGQRIVVAARIVEEGAAVELVNLVGNGDKAARCEFEG